MDSNLERREGRPRGKNRALIIRCDDPSWMELIDLIRNDTRWYLIYSKSSSLKLVVSEEAY